MGTEGDIFYFWWEEAYIAWLQSLGGGGILTTILTFLNNVFSFMGEEIFAIAVLGAVYWGLDKKKGARIGFALFFSMIVNNMIKNCFQRLRPYLCSERIELIRDVDGYSFPSAHSSSATALYPTLATEYKDKKWLRTVAVVIPLLIGLSRNYLGAHWPTDVLVGWALGLVCFALVEFVFPKLVKDELIIYVIICVIGLFGFLFCDTKDFYTSYGMMLGMTGGAFFDRKVARFENTKNIWYIILRTIGGALSFLIVSEGLKPVFALLADDYTTAYWILRTVRYALTTFVATGVYPMIFKPFETKILKLK